jgi:hypothetical protein
MCSRGREHNLRRRFHLWSFLCGKLKENCVVKIADGKAQVKRFLLHFCRVKNLLEKERRLSFIMKLLISQLG